MFPDLTGPAGSAVQASDLQLLPKGDCRERPCQTIPPHPGLDVSRDQRGAGRATDRAAARLHLSRRRSTIRRMEAEPSWPRCRTGRVRGRAAPRCACPRTCRPSWRRSTKCRCYQGAGAAPVPQDELPEVQGCQAARRLRSCRDGPIDSAKRAHRGPRRDRGACRSEANDVKDLLISCNMRLVVSIAKRHAGQTDNFFELLSDGNMSLIRAVEKFDYSRGNKFSTYASWAIMKNFARSIPDEKHRRERYVTGHEEVFDAAPDNRTRRARAAGHGRAGDAPGQPAAGVPASRASARSSACGPAWTTRRRR